MGETISADGVPGLTAFLARPKQPNGAIVVVLQEIFGINANMQAIVTRFAESGYVAVAPDLFWRQEHHVSLDPASESDRQKAMSLMQGLDEREAVADALACARTAARLTDVPGPIGAVGYCLGGKLAFLLATEAGISAAVAYYGVGIQNALDRATHVRNPLLLHIATEDTLCPPTAQQAIRDAFEHDALVEIIDHLGVGHAFARTGGGTYDPAAAARADEATARLLRHALLETT